MAITYQNLFTFTEVDPSSHIAVTSARVTFTDLSKNEDAYVSKQMLDKDSNPYFSGSFGHYLTVEITDNSTSSLHGIVWGVSTELDVYDNLLASATVDLLALELYYSSGTIHLDLTERTGNANYRATKIDIAEDTTYYITIIRNESVGTYGTLYVYIYTDAIRATLYGSASLALHKEADPDYLFALSSYNSGAAASTMSGYVEDVAVDVDVLPSVIQYQPSSIGNTTCTGNGAITSLGLSAVTAHGFVWDIYTEAAPTTTDSSSGYWGKVDDGAGALGFFDSSVTGLVPGIKYKMRAFATNTQGTDYSIGWQFTAGDAVSILEPGEIAIVGTEIRYGDYYGDLRKLEGSL